MVALLILYCSELTHSVQRGPDQQWQNLPCRTESGDVDFSQDGEDGHVPLPLTVPHRTCQEGFCSVALWLPAVLVLGV